MPGKKPFFSPFHPKFTFNKDGQPEGEHAGETWMALFIDLVYVAMLAKLSHFVMYCNPGLSAETFNVIIICFAIFNILFVGRLALDEYCNRFEENDIFHQILWFVYTYGSLLMVMNADVEIQGGAPHRMLNLNEDVGMMSRMLGGGGGAAAADDNPAPVMCVVNKTLFLGFSYGFYLTRGVIIMLYLGIMWSDKSGKSSHQFMPKVLTFALSSIIFGIGSAANNPVDLGYMLLVVSLFEVIAAIVIGFMAWLRMSCMGFYYPLFYEGAQERLGAFILLVVGESIITMINTVVSDTNTFIQNIAFHHFVNFWGLLLLYNVSVQYFERVQIYQGEEHAAKRGMGAGIFFAYGHSVLGFAILMLAQGIIAIASGLSNAAATDTARKLLGSGCAMTNVMMLLLYILHFDFRDVFMDPWGIFDVFMHSIFIVVHYALTWGPSDVPQGSYIMLHGLISLVTICFEAVLEHVRPAHLIEHHHGGHGHGGHDDHGHGHDDKHHEEHTAHALESQYPKGHDSHHDKHGTNPIHEESAKRASLKTSGH